MRARALLGLSLACGAGACTGVDFATGGDAEMIVAGAQFFPGEPPAGVADGVPVTSVTSANNTIHPGQTNKRLGGSVGGAGREVSLYFEGDVGYWTVPVGLQDPFNVTDLDFDSRISFARTIDLGPHDVRIQATDAEGHFGPPSAFGLQVAAATVPSSTLDVQLTWDTEADVDLHVTEPDGITIWARNLNSTMPPADPTQGGILDFDSNASCAIDGRREENVYWTVAPPAGHYVVKVDTWSLCGQTAARWHATATLNGAVLAQAHGESIDSDTTFTKSESAGVLAFTFDVP